MTDIVSTMVVARVAGGLLVWGPLTWHCHVKGAAATGGHQNRQMMRGGRS
jgi:hypothetical protein